MMESLRILEVRKEGSEIYVSVQVTINLQPNYTKREYKITRTVNDFDRLYVYLNSLFPDILVPTPPTLNIPETPLIKYSARKFLTRVLNHPVLNVNEGVISFFESEYLVLHLPSNIPGNSPKSRRHMIMSIFPSELKDVDDHLERAKLETQTIEGHLEKFARNAEELGSWERFNAISFNECALRFSQMKQDEAFQIASGIFNKIEELYHLHSRYLSIIFCELSYFQIQNTVTMQSCFEYRFNLLKSYDYACKRTQRKLGALNNLKQSTTIKQDKVDQAIEEVQRARNLEDEGRESLRKTTERVRSEYDSFKKHREQDLMEQVMSYAKKQLLLQQNVLKCLESFPLDHS